MRCDLHCPPKGQGGAAVAVVALAVYVAWQVAVVLAVVVAVALVVVGGLAWSTRLLRDRLSVVHWPAVQVQSAAVVHAELQRRPYELPAPPLAIEAPKTAIGQHDPPVVLSAVQRPGT